MTTIADVRIRTELAWRRAFIQKLKTIVKHQAEDEDLWFKAQTAPEVYLQQELRRLHRAIEGEE